MGRAGQRRPGWAINAHRAPAAAPWLLAAAWSVLTPVSLCSPSLCIARCAALLSSCNSPSSRCTLKRLPERHRGCSRPSPASWTDLGRVGGTEPHCCPVPTLTPSPVLCPPGVQGTGDGVSPGAGAGCDGHHLPQVLGEGRGQVQTQQGGAQGAVEQGTARLRECKWPWGHIPLHPSEVPRHGREVL